MNFFKNGKSNKAIQSKVMEQNETIHLFSIYHGVINEIISAQESGRHFIPISDFISEMAMPVFLPCFTGELQKILTEMGNNIYVLAKKLGYTQVDHNGYFIKPEKKDRDWISTNTGIMPDENQCVYVSIVYNDSSKMVEEAIYRDGEFFRTGNVVITDIVEAWQPKYVPKPYQAEKEILE